MKQLTVIFTILTALLLATSCSKEELPGGESTDEPGQIQTYTFTVSPDLAMKGDTPTRSAGTPEEMPTRCFMQIFGNNVSQDVQRGKSIENGSFTFSVNLPNTTYTFLFWADNGSGDTPTDLRAVQYTPGTVAFAARETNTPENMIENKVSLKHIVTKITLRHNGTNTFSPKTNDVMTATLPCATTYDISKENVSGNETYKFAHTFLENTPMTEATDICNFYVLSPSNANSNVEISFHNHALTINNISMQSDTHITLSGDFSSKNNQWSITEAIRKETLQSCFFDGDKPKGEYKESEGYMLYSNQETVNRFFSTILQRNNGSFLGETILGYSIYCTYHESSMMNIMINYVTFTIYFGSAFQDYTPTFEVPTFEKDW